MKCSDQAAEMLRGKNEMGGATTVTWAPEPFCCATLESREAPDHKSD